MTTTRTLPTDLEVLDRARSRLSEARDWLNSDTADTLAGRAPEVVKAMHEALDAIAEAKACIDAAKAAIYRGRRR